jgi:hypothetical protein
MNSNANEINRPILLIVIEGKGGVVKSTNAQIAIEALKGGHLPYDAQKSVYVMDTDTTNSNMTALGYCENKVIDTREENCSGGLYKALDVLEKHQFDHVVVDCGAREEDQVRPHILHLAKGMENIGGMLIVLRPITTNHFVQQNALGFVREFPSSKVGKLLALNCSMGRKSKDYVRWRATTSRSEALAAGAIEIEIESAGVVVADNATSFGLRFYDIAMGDFKRAPEKYWPLLPEIFDERISLFLLEWLKRSTAVVRTGILEIIAKAYP